MSGSGALRKKIFTAIAISASVPVLATTVSLISAFDAAPAAITAINLFLHVPSNLPFYKCLMFSASLWIFQSCPLFFTVCNLSDLIHFCFPLTYASWKPLQPDHPNCIKSRYHFVQINQELACIITTS